MSIAEISENSWNGILRVQESAYTGIPPENIHVLQSKWKASPETCFIFQAVDGAILAYLLSHSWSSSQPPKLFEELPDDSSGDILYLHDLAVSSESRGLGVGRILVEKFLDTAKKKGFVKVLLVAVQKSEGFWRAFGFKEIQGISVCPSYGEDAKLMSFRVCA